MNENLLKHYTDICYTYGLTLKCDCHPIKYLKWFYLLKQWSYKLCLYFNTCYAKPIFMKQNNCIL